MMKKFALIPVLALVLCTMLAGTALAREIIVMNSSSFPIAALNISATGSDDDSNLLTELLQPGEGLRINLEIDKGLDFIAVNADGKPFVALENIDLTGVNTLHIQTDGSLTQE